MASIDELLQNNRASPSAARPASTGDVPARTRRGRPASTRSSPSTTTSSSRPTRSTGARCRRSSPTQSRASSNATTAAERGSTTDSEFPNVGFNAVVGRPVERVQLRADPLRRDAPRRVGHPRAHRGHGHRRRVGVAVLPVVPARASSASGCSWARSDPRAGARDRPGVERLAIEAWSGAYPDRMIPMPAAVPPRSRGRRRTRSAATRERGFKAVTFSEAPRQARLAVAAHRPLGSDHAGVRGDRHGRVPAHRLVGHVADARTDDAPPDVVGVLFFGYAMFSAVDWLYSKIPVRFPNIRSACRRAASAGWPGSSTGSTTCSSYHDMYGTWTSDIDADARARCCGATSGSARSTTRPVSRMRDRIGVDHILVESDYPHADSTLARHAGACSTSRSGTCRPTTSRKMTWQNAARLFDFDVPASVVADPDAPWPSEQARGER